VEYVATVVLGALASLYTVGLVLVHRRRRARIDRLYELLNDMRQSALEQIHCGPSESATNGLSDVIASDIAELAELGLIALGDTVMEFDDTDAMRWVADADGTAFGRVWQGQPRAMFQLVSVTSERALVTVRNPRSDWWPVLARPPFVEDRVIDGTLAEAVSAHRARVEQEPGELVRVTTLDDAVRQWESGWARIAEWREAQVPDELFARDLRAFLGPQYEHLGAELRQRVDGLANARARMRA
jgi:hypothetical protein